MTSIPALGLCGDSPELHAQLRKSWIAATLVAPIIGPLATALFWSTSIPRPALVVWSLGHLLIGCFTLGALLAERWSRPTVANRLDAMYRIGMVALFGALPWFNPAAAAQEPDGYILAITMVIASAGGTISVAQFAGRRRLLISLVAVGNASYAVAYLVNDMLVMGLISLLWLVVSATVGAVGANVNVELLRLRQYEETAARTDHLTGLLNRQGLFEELARTDTGPRSLAIIDLDRFKLINDSFGHACGDRVLVEVAERLRDTLPSGSAIGRIGGDEFAAVLTEPGPDAPLQAILDDVLDVLSRPIDHGSRTIRIGASIGVTPLDEDATPSESFARADLSMYRSKGNAACQVTFFDASLQEELTRRVDLEQRFRRGLLEGSVTFWGQIIVRTADLEPVGIELLARWDDEGIFVSPNDFIPIAEETGLTINLGRLALDQAANVLTRWAEVPQLAELEVSVNIAPAHLANGLVDDVLARFPTPDRRLGIEFVETGLISSLRGDDEHLEALRAAGARLVIDDFGVGYSSLSYLSALPVDVLKIDRSFIENLATDPVRHRVVAAIANMAQALDLPCVAEGVEDAETAAVISDLGIERIQGFLYSRPQPLPNIEANLRQLLGVGSGAPAELALL